MYKTRQFNNLYKNTETLGVIYTSNKSTFSLWAPMASNVKLILFGKEGRNYKNSPLKTIGLTPSEKGIWKTEVLGDLNGEYYNYLVTNDGKELETVDPYAKAVCVNGIRGMVVDLRATDPKGFDKDVRPKIDNVLDSVLYEMHIRDFTIDENSGVSDENKGKFNGVWQRGTTIPKTNTKTCLEHLKELGITTVHLLPSFDFCTVDESNLQKPQFNWGYDPQNYNVPEGSYSTDPFNGQVRIKEFKNMVMMLHKAGIRVVMDVVYNHTFATVDSNLNKVVPEYYYRQDMHGNFSNGSGCGNELASERPMVRKFIVDSILYWAEEYHIDGFRFDLMGLEDINTMKEIRYQLDKIDRNIIVYGEGWTGGFSSLPSRKAAIKSNTIKYGSLQIAAFNDNIRDGIKGHVFNGLERGFINGQEGYEETIKFGVVAATYHSQVEYFSVDSSKEAWANEPYQAITYASAHDNFTLWDKLQVSCSGASNEELVAMNKLSCAIILTSQGIPFIQSGEEFARTKVNPDGSLNENSYNSPDSVNKIDWKRKEEYRELFEYYKGLISLRKSHKAFRMRKNSEIQDNLKFLRQTQKSVVGFMINGKNIGDSSERIVVIYNGRDEEVTVDLPEEDWDVVVDKEKAGTEILFSIKGDKVTLPKKSAFVLLKQKSDLEI